MRALRWASARGDWLEGATGRSEERIAREPWRLAGLRSEVCWAWKGGGARAGLRVSELGNGLRGEGERGTGPGCWVLLSLFYFLSYFKLTQTKNI